MEKRKYVSFSEMEEQLSSSNTEGRKYLEIEEILDRDIFITSAEKKTRSGSNLYGNEFMIVAFEVTNKKGKFYFVTSAAPLLEKLGKEAIQKLFEKKMALKTKIVAKIGQQTRKQYFTLA